MKAVCAILDGKPADRIPIWLMRQAGRYLPEYRASRTRAGSFLDLCYNAELAAEVTLQPIRRFGFDASIIFSDILVVPHALGQQVGFAEGEGPRLEAIRDRAGLDRLARELDLARLQPVFDALRLVRADLPGNVALLGFCGAPWTVAGYMLAGRGGEALEKVRLTLYREPDFVTALIDRLVEASITYLSAQLDAGADAVQIFESFAGALPPDLFERWSLAPVRRIIEGVRARRPDARIIVFARGTGSGNRRVVTETGASAVGLDWTTDLQFAAELQKSLPVQGNLDPLVLVAGGAEQRAAVGRILDRLGSGPLIFNLGHGILPETPVDHVAALVRQVREFSPAGRVA